MEPIRRVGAVIAVVVAVLVTMSGCGSSGAPTDPATAPPPAPTRPLRILVTNDDGWSAPGLLALRDALRTSGHTVVVVAPAENQSGTSGALSLADPLTLTRPTTDPAVWAVGGRPSDAVSVGLHSVLASAPPDLVVSGINSGNNVTASSFHSGTIGAAMTAVETGVPAIAVSGPTARAGDASPGQYSAAADFTARLIATLGTRSAGDQLLPPGMVLNVNYPVLAPRTAASVVAAPTADGQGITVTYSPGPGGSVVPQVAQAPPAGGDDDASVIARGQVALTDLAADPAAPSPAYGVAAAVAPQLRP